MCRAAAFHEVSERKCWILPLRTQLVTPDPFAMS